MSFCYLYDKSPSSPSFKRLLDYFDASAYFDLNTVDKLEKYEVYIVDIQTVDKNISSKLNSLLKQKKDSLIYFIIPKKYNLMLIKLMFMIGTEDVFTQTQDVDKIISKINLDKEEHALTLFEKNLGRLSTNTQSFMAYKDGRLTYVSDKLLKDLNCETLEKFEDNICSSIDINKLFEEEVELKQLISSQQVSKEYLLKSVKINKNETVIYFEPYSSVLKSSEAFKSISSRVTFMELLKQKLNDSGSRLTAITIGINEIKKLQEDLKAEEIEEYSQDILYFMNSLLEDRLIFAQLDKYFYIVLFEDKEFDDVHEMADTFHKEVLTYLSNKEFKIAIDVFAMSLKNFNLGDIFSIFKNIKSKELTYEQKHSNLIQHTSSTQTVISENSLLDDAYRNKTEFKLLNIYNGLVISTPSKIVKKTADGIYVSFERLQGVVMKIENSTVLQSSTFLHDIQANIKIMDSKKKIAFLDDFKFLNTNVNARKYARVSTTNKIPISILCDGTTINGIILDMSIKSLAISVKYSNKVEELEGEKVSLSFNIPNFRFDEGYTRLKLSATVAVILRNQTDGICKIVCDLDKNSTSASVISEYVHDRQKELIIEVKKMSKLV